MTETKLVPYQSVTTIPARSALVFAPHHDDEIFGCGATLTRLAAQGVPVQTIVVTDGAYGSSIAQDTLMTTRETESRAAATLMGLPEPEFWRLPDRGLEYGEALVVRLVDTMRKHDADLVYAPSLHEAHPDHRALAMAAVEAVRCIGADLSRLTILFLCQFYFRICLLVIRFSLPAAPVTSDPIPASPCLRPAICR